MDISSIMTTMGSGGNTLERMMSRAQSLLNTWNYNQQVAQTNAMNENIAKMNVFSQMKANEDNLRFQKESLDYQKALNEELMNREDTAYQRTVEDMRNAGLNPLMLSSTNGSGGQVSPIEPMQTTAINYPEYKQEKKAQLQYELAATLDEIGQAISLYQNLEMNEITKRKANAEADIAETKADFEKFMNPIDKEYESWEQYYRNKGYIHDYHFGYNPNMTDFEKAKRLFGYAKNKNEYLKKENESDENLGLNEILKQIYGESADNFRNENSSKYYGDEAMNMAGNVVNKVVNMAIEQLSKRLGEAPVKQPRNRTQK